MGLDLGTLGIRIQATTGDSVNRLNGVSDAVQNVTTSTNHSAQSFNALNTAAMNFNAQKLLSAFKEITTAAEDEMGPALLNAAGSVASMFGPYGQVVGAVLQAGSAIWTSLNTKSKEELDAIEKRCEEIKTQLSELGTEAQKWINDAEKNGTTATLEEYAQLISDITGLNFSDIEGAVGTFNENVKAAFSGDGQALDLFNKLHISLYGEDGSKRPTESILTDTLAQIALFDSKEEQIKALTALFGDSEGLQKYLDILKEIAGLNLGLPEDSLNIASYVAQWEAVRDAAKETYDKTMATKTASLATTSLESEAKYWSLRTDLANGKEGVTEEDVAAAYHQFQVDMKAWDAETKKIVEDEASLNKWLEAMDKIAAKLDNPTDEDGWGGTTVFDYGDYNAVYGIAKDIYKAYADNDRIDELYDLLIETGFTANEANGFISTTKTNQKIWIDNDDDRARWTELFGGLIENALFSTPINYDDDDDEPELPTYSNSPHYENDGDVVNGDVNNYYLNNGDSDYNSGFYEGVQ